jgi:hypothetical protein
MIEGLQVGDSYQSSSLDELLGDQGDATVGELMSVRGGGCGFLGHDGIGVI